MNKMIKISSDPGDWVGDIFSGSGGTLLACRELGRHCISIERNPDYLEIIKRKARIDQDIIFKPDEKLEVEKKVQTGLDSF
jgi:DNA modification methylase